MVHPVIFYVPHLNKTKVKATNRKKKTEQKYSNKFKLSKSE